jgi:hypothetical protein
MLATAVFKVFSWESAVAARSSWFSTSYATIVIGELALAAMLASKAWARIACVLVAGAFSGAAVATLAAMVGGEGGRACRCLGNIEMNHASALLIQGAVIVLATMAHSLGSSRGKWSATQPLAGS